MVDNPWSHVRPGGLAVYPGDGWTVRRGGKEHINGNLAFSISRMACLVIRVSIWMLPAILMIQDISSLFSVACWSLTSAARCDALQGQDTRSRCVMTGSTCMELSVPPTSPPFATRRQ